MQKQAYKKCQRKHKTKLPQKNQKHRNEHDHCEGQGAGPFKKTVRAVTTQYKQRTEVYVRHVSVAEIKINGIEQGSRIKQAQKTKKYLHEIQNEETRRTWRRRA